MTTFHDLGLCQPLLKALEEERYHTPTPIQAQSIPSLLAGRDLLGIAQTGTGKTAAFALPILHRLVADPKPAPRRGARVLVLSPTRELASQIAESFEAYGRHLGLRVAVVYGGVGYRPQIEALARGLHVLVATPGRLLDHIAGRAADLRHTEVLVLDEADQMLDLGFIKPIRQIVANLPANRQNLLFSATMPREIAGLADQLLRSPVKVAVTPAATTVERVTQRVIHVDHARKRALLAELMADPALKRGLVFTRTKRGADRVARHLEGHGVTVAAIHGNKSQRQREAALDDFRENRIRVLVATDIAARGIDVEEVSHVVNFELPEVPEVYVHRIGRTARAGASGVAISLCAGDERDLLRAIERVTRQAIPAEDRRGDASLERDEPRGSARQHQPTGRHPGHGGPARAAPRGRNGSGQGQERALDRASHAETGFRRGDHRGYVPGSNSGASLSHVSFMAAVPDRPRGGGSGPAGGHGEDARRAGFQARRGGRSRPRRGSRSGSSRVLPAT